MQLFRGVKISPDSDRRRYLRKPGERSNVLHVVVTSMYFVHKLGFGSPQAINTRCGSSTVRPQVVDSRLLITPLPGRARDRSARAICTSALNADFM